MTIVTIKESAAFPEIGQIRKGAAKTKEGYVGKDLKTHFRMIFFPGQENEKSLQRFTEQHRDEIGIIGGSTDLMIERLTIFLPFPDPMHCFESYYEAYTAGRMVARADGERFLRWVDTQTGEVKVDNGEPYTPFTRGQAVGSYVNRKTGKTETIQAKAVGRLKIVLPELARMAFFTLMTTSIYDIVRITEQLRAIHWISQFLPHRNGVAGIPLVLSRRLTDVTWVQADGSARRVKTGLINIEADPDWVEKMLRSLADQALPAGLEKALLPAGNEVIIDIPAEDQEQAGEQADLYQVKQGDGEALVPGETEEAPIPGEAEPEGQPDAQPLQRPYPLDVLRSRLQEKAANYQGQEATPGQRGLVAMLLNEIFAGDGAEEKRHTVITALFGLPSLNDVDPAIILAMLNTWLKPKKDSGDAYFADPMAERELHGIYSEILKAPVPGETEGQIEMQLKNGGL